MNKPSVADALEVVSSWAGIAAPVLYFALQLLSAPFFPEYRFLTNVASDLGSERSSFPALFNGGAMVVGSLICIAAARFARAARRRVVRSPLLWLTALTVLLAGSSSLWAGIYPLPDSRHGANPFTIGLIAMPFLGAVTFWKERPLARGWLILPVIVMIAAMLVRSGLIQVDTRAFEGLFQRVLALAAFSPIAVAAWVLLPRAERPSGLSNNL
jgi:glucans biosynthesis protein C